MNNVEVLVQSDSADIFDDLIEALPNSESNLKYTILRLKDRLGRFPYKKNKEFLEAFEACLFDSMHSCIIRLQSYGYLNELLRAVEKLISFYNLIIYLSGSSGTVSDLKRTLSENFASFDFDELFNSRVLTQDKEEFPERELISIGKILNELRGDEFHVYGKGFSRKSYQWNRDNSYFEHLRTEYFMQIRIEVGASSERAMPTLITPIWMITSALSSIDGVAIELVDIRKGSVKADCRVWMPSEKIKKLVQDVLSAAKESAIKKILNVDSSDLEKTKLEVAGLSVENDIKRKELDSMPTSEFARRMQEVELKIKEADLRAKNIANSRAEVLYLKELAELVEKGYISSEEFKLYIGEKLYFGRNRNGLLPFDELDIRQIS